MVNEFAHGESLKSKNEVEVVSDFLSDVQFTTCVILRVTHVPERLQART